MANKQSTFASLAIYNYRVFFFGGLISNIGGWIAFVAQDWLVLTELTNQSSAALGLVAGLQFLPVAVLAPFAGSIVDRVDKRKMLMITQVFAGLNAATLFTLVATGNAQLWHVYTLAAVLGVTMSFDNPARQAFVSEMVPTLSLPNAIALNSASFNSARLVGPGLAGVMIGAFGIAPALAINTVSFVAVLFALLIMRPSELHPTDPASGRGGVRDGIAYVRARGDIMLIMFIVFMLGTFGMNFQITNALMATKVFSQGPEAYGMLGSIMAIGSLAAALIAARRARPRLRVLLGSLLAFSVSTLLLAVAPNYLVYAILLVPTGLSALTVMTMANSSVQMACAPEYRGRVMALYMAIFLGGTPIGAPIIGWVGEVFGARWTLAIGSIATGLACLIASGYLMIHQGLRLSLERRSWPPRLLVTKRRPKPLGD